jgi:hypothetical protein
MNADLQDRDLNPVSLWLFEKPSPFCRYPPFSKAGAGNPPIPPFKKGGAGGIFLRGFSQTGKAMRF